MVKEMPLATIGIPVFGRPESMVRAINSVLSQTYLNLEIIISNNNSPNHLVNQVAEDFLKKDSRVKYFKHNKSLRITEHYKFISQQAKGKYFMWLADDDWLDLNYIEKCLFFLELNSSYSSCTGNLSIYSESGSFIKKEILSSINYDNPTKRMFQFYKSVGINSEFYSLTRTDYLKKILINDVIGFDWHVVAANLFKGKLKVLPTLCINISQGGESSNHNNLALKFGKPNFFSRNFLGLMSAINASKDIFLQKIYTISYINKIYLSLSIFFIVYKKTIMWDYVILKRRLIKQSS